MNAWLQIATSLAAWAIGLLVLWQRVTVIRADAKTRQLFQRHVFKAVEELTRLAIKAKSERVRVAAIRELLDRGYGKLEKSHDDKLDGK